MPEQWDAYIADLDGEIASFYVDLGLIEQAPIAAKPWSLFIRLPLLNPREDGLTQGDEFEVLNAVDDAVLAALKETDAVYAGRMTTDGRRVMVFYSSREIEAVPLLEGAMQKFPEYECETWSTEDADWHFYKCTLYPHPEELQMIQNRSVLEALQGDGDKLDKPREVTHWVYFAEEKDRTAFVESVEALRYRVDCHVNEEWAPQIYAAVLNRIDRVDENSINEVVLQLFRLANHHEGEYDGWETSVETDKPVDAKRHWWKRIFSK